MSEKFKFSQPEEVNPSEDIKSYNPEDFPKEPHEMTEEEYAQSRAKEEGVKSPSEEQFNRWRHNHRQIIRTKPKLRKTDTRSDAHRSPLEKEPHDLPSELLAEEMAATKIRMRELGSKTEDLTESEKKEFQEVTDRYFRLFEKSKIRTLQNEKETKESEINFSPPANTEIPTGNPEKIEGKTKEAETITEPNIDKKTPEEHPKTTESWAMTSTEYINTRAKETGTETPTRDQQIAWSREHIKLVEDHFTPKDEATYKNSESGKLNNKKSPLEQPREETLPKTETNENSPEKIVPGEELKSTVVQSGIEATVRKGITTPARLAEELGIDKTEAQKLIDTLESIGVVGPFTKDKKRKILWGKKELSEAIKKSREMEKASGAENVTPPKEGDPSGKSKDGEWSKEKPEEEKTREETEEKTGIEIEPKSIEEQFAERFGITPEELKGVEGFAELSEGRKLLVLENLKQITLGRIEEEAQEKHKKEAAESSLAGRIWKSASKYYQIAKHEKATAEELKTGGLTAHGEVLQQLIRGAKNGPEAVTNKNGEVKIQFATEKDFIKTAKEIGEKQILTTEEKQILSQFSEAAGEYGDIPYEWSLETATKSQQEQFKKAQEKYNQARTTLRENLKNRERTCLQYAINTEQKMYVNQYLTAHPNVEKQLEKINSKSVWAKVLKDTVTERGLYFGAGFATRSLAVGLLGLAAAPMTAAALGGFRSWQKAKETIGMEKKSSRRGHIKTKKVEVAGGEIEKKDTDFADAKNLNERMEKLFKRLESGVGSNGKEMTKQEEQITRKNLGRLASLAYYKYQDGLINFGNNKERLITQQELITNLGRSVAFATVIDEKLKLKVNSLIDLRKTKISKKDEKYIKKEILKGATIGAGFATAGWLARHLLDTQDISSLQENREYRITPGGEQQDPYPKFTADTTRVTEQPPPETLEGTPSPTLSNIDDLFETKIPEKTTTEFIEEVRKGDSIWKLAERQLKDHYGEKFDNLRAGQKTFLIDSIKDKITADPEKFGLNNPDQIKVGQNIDFSSIFKEENEIQNVFGKAESLEEAAIGNIEKNNALLKDWVSNHPGESLTSDKVDEVLSGALDGKVALADKIAEAKENLGPANETDEVTPRTEFPSAEAQLFGSATEAHAAKTFGFTPHEYQNLRNISVGEFLDQIPAYGEAPEVWIEVQNRITLPSGPRNVYDFEKLMKLSAFIQEKVPFVNSGMRTAKIGTLLKQIWPEE